MTMHAQALLELWRALGLDAEEIRRRETPERVVAAVSVPVERFDGISTKLRNLVKVFGSALDLSVGLESADPLLRIRQGVLETDLDAGLKEVVSFPKTMGMHVDLQIDKNAVLDRLGLDLERYYGLFYLFFQNVLKLLRAPLTDLDQRLFSSAHKSTVMIVSDTAAVCQGELFAVFGAQSTAQLKKVLPSLSTRREQEIRGLQLLATESLNWLGFRLEHLTPLHFICSCEGSEELARLLANHLLQLTVVYTANRTAMSGPEINALYASSEQSVHMAVSETSVATELQKDLVRLITWLQTTGETDKLTIFQNVVAREITGDVQAENFQSFLRRLPHLLREAQWHYRVHIDGKINKHFDKVQSVNSQIASATKEISQNLDSMTKGFVDTLLASVGVVILTLLASLAENKTQGLIFRAGMWAYAVYLLIFQVFYRMGHLYYSHSLISKESEEQLTPFRIALGDDKIQELTTSLRERERYFKRMFRITIGFYVFVILVIVAAGIFLPSLIGQLSGVASTPTPTPIPTPGNASP